MSDTSNHSPLETELTGEYRTAMETVSARLMSRLPDSEELWLILSQTETLLTQAQLTKTPVQTLFGKGGVAGFCQSIIDEQIKKHPQGSITAAESKPSEAKKRKTADKQIQKKKNLVTVAIIAGWLLLVSVLIGWYTGLISYLLHPQESYLSELHNFSSNTTILADTKVQVTLPLTSGQLQQEVIYQDGSDSVALTYIGCDEDELSAEKGGLRHYWIEFSYPRHTSFSEITYISPAESGTATVTLPDGKTITQSIYWKSDGCSQNGLAYVRLYVLSLPKNTNTDGLSFELSLDSMTHVQWTRHSVGPQNH